jgi:hypothetical protein
MAGKSYVRADDKKPGKSSFRLEFGSVVLDLTNGERDFAARKAAGYQVMVRNGVMSLEEAATAIVQDLTSLRQARAFALHRQ